MNKSAVFAILTGFLIVVFAQGRNLSDILVLLQPEAFLVVIGGTLCATILNYSPEAVKNAFISAKEVFMKKENINNNLLLNEIYELAKQARHKGVFSLYEKSNFISNPFLKRGVQLAVDIESPQLLYDILESEISYEEEKEIKSAKIFEAMGGYAPTFGIVGAVLGLIRIMNDLQNFETIGIGIATAFVATLYGVGIANLVLLPIAGKLKAKVKEKIMFKEVILQGIMAIHMRENSAVLEEKIFSYLKYHNQPTEKPKMIGLLAK